jgi:hypothetical protein
VAKANRIYRVLGSNKFFYFVVGLFIFEAAWIAFTALYPMAFDEQFHLGIIKLYSHQHGPFFAGQPIGADTYGAVARDPSYMYHYLMSFPYRLIAALTHSTTAQIIVLRLTSVAFIAASSFIFRRLLRYLKASPVMINSVLLVFVSIPVVPFLAAQINYDNLLIPLTALTILWALRLYQSIADGKINYLLLLSLAALCLFTSLVKYAFLPIFFVIGVIMVVTWFRHRTSTKHMWSNLRKLPRLQFYVLIALLLVCLGLFVERYGDNTLHYGTPIPECDQVLSVAECQSYSPWARNYEFIQTQPHVAWIRVVPYIGTWVHVSLRESVFTITSRFDADARNQVDYYTPPELPVPYVIAWAAFFVGLISLFISVRQLWKRQDLRIVMTICAFYISTLWLQNFLDYKHLGQPVAIHGRYLLPIMPLLVFIWFEAIKIALTRLGSRFSINARALQPWLLGVVVIVFMIEGGGFVSFIALSRSDWFWQQSRLSQTINYEARRILNPLIIGN